MPGGYCVSRFLTTFSVHLCFYILCVGVYHCMHLCVSVYAFCKHVLYRVCALSVGVYARVSVKRP